MEAIGAILALLGLVSIVAVIKPFGPYKKRWHALIGAVALFGVGGALMPDVSEAPSAADSGAADNITSQTTQTVAEQASSETVAPPERSPSRWKYSRRRDEMRNADEVLACLRSTNELEFDFPYQGGSYSEICFRESPQFGFDTWVRIEKGQFVCVVGCRIRTKFDQGEVESISASGASDGSSDIVFLSNPRAFLNETKGASRIVVEAEFYQAGMHQMVFEDAAGLDWPAPVSER